MVVVLEGTNCADILDNALVCPVRCDRQIQVDKPDVKGRQESFKVQPDFTGVVEEREDVTYHEACHTIIGWFLEHADQLFKVTFIPRSSGVLGYTQGSKVQGSKPRTEDNTKSASFTLSSIYILLLFGATMDANQGRNIPFASIMNVDGGT